MAKPIVGMEDEVGMEAILDRTTSACFYLLGFTAALIWNSI